MSVLVSVNAELIWRVTQSFIILHALNTIIKHIDYSTHPQEIVPMFIASKYGGDYMLQQLYELYNPPIHRNMMLAAVKK